MKTKITPPKPAWYKVKAVKATYSKGKVTLTTKTLNNKRTTKIKVKV